MAKRPTIAGQPIPRRTRKVPELPPVRRWRCVGTRGCGAVLTSWAGAERHVDEEHGGGRLEVVFGT